MKLTNKMIRRLVLISAVFINCNLFAQNWENLEYNQDQPGLEHNPLKGFMTLWNPGNNFPHSIQGHNFGLNQVMNGMYSFDWTAIENELNKDMADGNFSTIQVIIDPANGSTLMPGFLKDQVEWVLKTGDTPSLCPDWNNETLIQAMLNFIAAFGEKYNNDPRVFSITLGLYGMWGEWHVGSDKTFEMTPANKVRIANAYKRAFPDMNLKARYPGPMPDPQIYGYSDGLVFGQSWYFFNQLKSAYADQNWKQHVISGEIDPDLQSTIWKSWPNAIGEDVTAVIDSVHPTHLISHYILTKLYGGTQEWDNAIRAQKMMGYTLFVKKYRLTASEGYVNVEVEIENTGVAPMHANWDIEIGVIDPASQFRSLGKTKWNLKNILPDDKGHYRAFTASTVIEDGTYTILLRVVNPLEEHTSKADPVRFANTAQDEDIMGWITLGEMDISGGICGEPPVSISGIILSADTLDLTQGESTRIIAQILPENATCKDITWYSDHPYTASVDSSGLIVAGPLTGQATIYAITQDGNYEASIVLKVEPDWIGIPGRMEAEDYLNLSGVQTQETNDIGGGLNVGWIDSGDWMEYAVTNQSSGVYFSAGFRLSSPGSDGKFRVYLDNNLIGELTVLNTGSWQSWETVITNLKIDKGEHILKILSLSGEFNLNYVDFEVENIPGRDPFELTPWQFPGDSILAWQYDYIHYRSDDRYFSLDSANTIGIYGCNDNLGINIRSYTDAVQHSDAAQFNWDPTAGTFQKNGQWIEYTAEFNNNMPYQLLLRARNNMDANFNLTISRLEGETIFHRDINLENDVKYTGPGNEFTSWYASTFPVDVPWGVYIVRFDWHDQQGEPGIFGSFTFTESKLDITAPELLLVTTGIFDIGTYLQVLTNEESRVYLVPEGTPGNADSLNANAVAIIDVLANAKGYFATDQLNSGDYVVYAQDSSNNISSASLLITLQSSVNTKPISASSGTTASYDPVNKTIIVNSTRQFNQVAVFNIHGKNVGILKYVGKEIEFHTFGLPSGIYFVQVYEESGKIITKKLVKR